MSSPEISLVVVAWNSQRDLRELIQSMSSSLPAPEQVELIVVDNASTEDPTSTAQQWRGPVICERLESNRGFGAAANRGVALATAPVCVICNPDVRLIDESFLSLGGLAARRQALVGPRLLWSDGSIQPSASGPVVGFWPWVAAFIPGRIQPRWLVRHTEPWRLEGVVEVTWLTGAVIAAPTPLLRRLGPFEESIELMYEDLDLCLRANRTGVKCLFAPGAGTAIHIGGTAREKRFPDQGLALAHENRRKVISTAFGSRAADRSTAAFATKLRLRAFAKRLLRRDADYELAELSAISNASEARSRP